MVKLRYAQYVCMHKKLTLGYITYMYFPLTDGGRYDTRCYFNVRSKADMSQLNRPHGNNN